MQLPNGQQAGRPPAPTTAPPRSLLTSPWSHGGHGEPQTHGPSASAVSLRVFGETGSGPVESRRKVMEERSPGSDSVPEGLSPYKSGLHSP